jgi:hypothetical protein
MLDYDNIKKITDQKENEIRKIESENQKKFIISFEEKFPREVADLENKIMQEANSGRRQLFIDGNYYYPIEYNELWRYLAYKQFMPKTDHHMTNHKDFEKYFWITW